MSLTPSNSELECASFAVLHVSQCTLYVIGGRYGKHGDEIRSLGKTGDFVNFTLMHLKMVPRCVV